MADRIYAMVAARRGVIEGVDAQNLLHEAISRFATAEFFKNPIRGSDRLRKQILRLVAKDFLPEAQKVGAKAARPILEAMGGEPLVKKGSVLRGRVLDGMRRYHKANLRAFHSALRQELGTLSGEIESAFARSYRDGIARKQLVTDLVESSRDELKRLRVVRGDVRQAAQKVKKAEAKVAKASRRRTRQAKTELRKAKKAHVKAKAKIGTAKSFFARFETRVQGQARDTIRREAERAQFSTFRQAGYATFTWVTVNGSDACPSCEQRHGRTLAQSKWRAEGMPGDGATFCGSACMCCLVPAEYKDGNQTLDSPLST